MQRIVGAAMLTVLAGLPVMATTCEALCDRAVAIPATDVADASMDEGMTGCHESSTPAGQRITGTSAHDCRTHDDGIRETEAPLTGSRVAAGTSLIANLPAFATIVFAPSSVLARAGYSPPQAKSFSPAPLVLRV